MATNLVRFPLEHEGEPIRPEVSFGQFTGAHSAEALRHSPLGSAFGGEAGAIPRMLELGIAKRTGTLLSPQQATEEFGIEGALQFDSPVTNHAAEIMRSRKLREVRGNMVIQMGGDQFGAAGLASGFAVQMAASMKDPLNVASMFVPVVGEGRLAVIGTKTVARAFASRTGQRLATGAIEGVVGQAMLEPFAVAAALQEKADYGVEDAAVNLVAGAILGAGAHGLLGKAADLINGYTPETRTAARNTAISQTARGEPVDVGDVVRLDRNQVRKEVREEMRNQFLLSSSEQAIEARVYPAIFRDSPDWRRAKATDQIWRVEGVEMEPTTKKAAIARARAEVRSKGGVEVLKDEDFREIKITAAMERAPESILPGVGRANPLKKNDVVLRLDRKRVKNRLNRNTIRGEDELLITPSFDKARPSDKVWEIKRTSSGTSVEQSLTKPQALARAKQILESEGVALSPEDNLLLNRAVEREVHRRLKEVQDKLRAGVEAQKTVPTTRTPGETEPPQVKTGRPSTDEIETRTGEVNSEAADMRADMDRKTKITEDEENWMNQMISDTETVKRVAASVPEVAACISKNIASQ